MLLLGLDFETGGSIENIHQNWIIEIGAVLWDTSTNTPVQMMNRLIWQGFESTPDSIEVHGITNDQLRNHGVPLDYALNELSWFINRCNIIVAHNGLDFELPLLNQEFAKVPNVTYPAQRPWLDTIRDIKYPKKFKSLNLTHLAAYHSFINPFEHRAVTDVLTMLKILSSYNLDEVIRRANEPTLIIKALVSYDDREKAKKVGFKFYGDRKSWEKELKKSDYANESLVWNFNHVVLSEIPRGFPIII